MTFEKRKILTKSRDVEQVYKNRPVINDSLTMRTIRDWYEDYVFDEDGIYIFKPDKKGHTVEDEFSTGFELELEFKDRDKAINCAYMLHESFQDNELKIISDGSISIYNGFEAVTNIFGMKGIGKILTRMNYVFRHFSNSDLERNTDVGLHISLNFDDVDISNRINSIRHFVVFINNLYGYWDKISGRFESRYAKRNIKLISDVNFIHQDKYSCVNIDGVSTLTGKGRIEVRSFWRTLNTKLIYERIKILHLIKQFSQTDECSDIVAKTFGNDTRSRFYALVSYAESINSDVNFEMLLTNAE